MNSFIIIRNEVTQVSYDSLILNVAIADVVVVYSRWNRMAQCTSLALSINYEQMWRRDVFTHRHSEAR